MAKILPEFSEADLCALASQAEAKVYRAFRDHLPSSFLVLFQVGWILQRQDSSAQDGETDFLVCHPEKGYLCLEVKGGGIGFDSLPGEWYSIDRYGVRHAIKNPVSQALRAKYSIRAKLNEDPRWLELRLDSSLRAHAIFLSDIGDRESVRRPDLPEALIGTTNDLGEPLRWVEGVFDYWRNEIGPASSLGRAGVEIIERVFARSFFVGPLISQRLAEQEITRTRLTENQMMVLDLLRAHRRAAVSGGAGTGKTLLALEKAKRLAAEGYKTLLTCYNRRLADHLTELCSAIAGLEVLSFHQLCYRFIAEATKITGRDLVSEAKSTYPGADLYDVQWPNALAYATEVVPGRYDAIVCDEGQDFREEYWMPLELLLSDYDGSPLYVFYDDNQNIYSRASTFPIRGEPYTLTINCRNTAKIHSGAYRFYRGVPVEPPLIEGDDIEYIKIPTIDRQAQAIASRITELSIKHSVWASDMVVLLADAQRKSEYYAALKKRPLPRPITWVIEGDKGKNGLVVDTVNRFKGLEATIVFMWGLDTIDLEKSKELLYVGLSRAKALLIVVGNGETCNALDPFSHNRVAS